MPENLMLLTTEQTAYLNHHMKKVSRSFALVVSYLEKPLREQMTTAVMAKGMRRLENPNQTTRLQHYIGVQMLADVEDYDRYCYYVAGTVGHMATELAINHYQLDQNVAEDLLASCEACGRGLQKTNIVKDFAKDLRRGISYLPDLWLREVNYLPLFLAGASPLWTLKVITNVLSELRQATNYVLALPYTAAGYRRASLMCLLPPYQTLLLATKRQESLFTADHRVKISRLTMARCIWDSRSMMADNDAIKQYSQRLHDAVEEALSASEFEQHSATI